MLSSFFTEIKYGIKSSMAGGRKGGGGYRTAASTVQTSSMDDLDDSRPAAGYGCLGRRSTSMECGLSSAGRRRRKAKLRKQNSSSAQSLDRLSDRVYSAMSLIEYSHRSTPGRTAYECLMERQSSLIGNGLQRLHIDPFTPERSVYGTKSSSSRSAPSSNRILGRRCASSSQLVNCASAAPRQRSSVADSVADGSLPRPSTAAAAASGLGPPGSVASTLRRSDSTQSAASSVGVGGLTPVPRSRVHHPSSQTADESALAPATRRVRNPANVATRVRRGLQDSTTPPISVASRECRTTTPDTHSQQQQQQQQQHRIAGRSQSSPGDRAPLPPPPSRATPSRRAPPPPIVDAGPQAATGSSQGPIGGSGGLVSRVVPKSLLDVVDGGLFCDRSAAYVHDTRAMTSYRKGRLLGKGGFAKCYELTDLKSGKTYAGKIIAKSRLLKGNQKEKILREVELHHNLRHCNVVGFHSYFEDDGYVYMVLENCSRKSLVHVLKNRVSLTEPEVRYYMHHLVAGLRYIHGQRIIHRDLKLGNMLLNEAMQLKIADFGLATRVEYEGEKKMTVCGTPNYIAPEVLQKRGHSYEADIWALGCIMYALLCGRPPFETATLKETYMRIVNNKFTMPPQVSRTARDLICNLLTLNPRDRPSLDRIDADDYFTDGHMPIILDPSACDVPPKYPVPSNIPIKPRTSVSQMANKENNPCGTPSPLAQTKGSRKSASQIITRAKTPDIETTGSILREGYPHQAGSAPSIQPDSPIDISGLPIWSPVRLYRLLLTCLDTDVVSNSVVTQVHRPRIMCITKWVDYSNKYGFGFQLSDRSVGILFNDNTRMLLTSDASTVQYNDLSNRTHSFSAQSPITEHQKKVTLLLYFAEYMDTHLIPGGNVNLLTQGNEQPAPIFMKKWFRTDRAIVMYLSNGTLQVNFLDDHTKIIINPDTNQDYLVTYVNNARQATSYLLTAVRHFGCTADVIERIRYACRMLERIINVDGESV